MQINIGLCPHVGKLLVLPARPSEHRQLFRRGGFLSASNASYPQRRPHLTYTDGTPFWWLADTWWSAPSASPHLAQFTAALAWRAKQGFTAVQIHGSRGFGRSNVSAAVQHPFDITFWQKQDGYYEAAAAHDMLLVVGFSRGDLLTRFPHSVAVLPTIFAYHMARFGAFPISYLITQEYNCNTYSTRPDIPRLEALGQLLHNADPYQRALTMHPAVLHLDTKDAWSSSWYQFAMAQQGHLVNNNGVTLEALLNFSQQAHQLGFPAVNAEANYEGFVRGWQVSVNLLQLYR